MSESWCGLCFIGPMTLAELAEHYRELHAPTGEPLGARLPPSPKPKAPPERMTGFKACDVCGAPLIEDEEGVCVFCE